MHENNLVSILIAHYNHHKLLPNLLDSILNQSLKAIEVVLVDDASTKPCTEIVEAYKNKGLNINFVQHEKNQGLKNTRCTGIKNANSPIIHFADADDTLYGTTALEYHVDLMRNHDADIVHFNALHYEPDKKTVEFFDWAKPLATSLNNNGIFETYLHEHLKGHVVWNKLYSRELCLIDINFLKNSTVTWACEDLFFTTWFFFHAKKYIGSPVPGYFYNNCTQEKRDKDSTERICNVYRILQEILPYIKEHSCNESILALSKKALLNTLYSNFNRQCSQIYINNNIELINKVTEEKLCNNDTYTKALHYALFESRETIKAQNEIIANINKQ